MELDELMATDLNEGEHMEVVIRTFPELDR